MGLFCVEGDQSGFCMMAHISAEECGSFFCGRLWEGRQVWLIYFTQGRDKAVPRSGSGLGQSGPQIALLLFCDQNVLKIITCFSSEAVPKERL
ncbi:hypothetical protein NPIL_692661 [Nephila pilipes]|uniref:Uncharacterized protein n=1 Tax=Nephila pilipes TaxID=299642 RepID=A0A8X6Q720_NEPPI|nr:hypothetical protein NPIL_692661 [Nephila pilipes]